MNSLSDFDPDKFCLGKLCKRGHDWNGTGKTLRTNDWSRTCPECKRQRRLENIEHYKAKDRARYLSKQEEFIRAARERREKAPEKYRQQNKESYLRHKEQRQEGQRNYYRNNRDKALAARKEYVRQGRHTETNRASNEKRRAQKRTSIIQHLGKTQAESIKKKFDWACGYCESNEDLTLDHFIPLSKGGTHVEANLVCACRSCNNRKHTSDPYTWYSRQEFFSKQKWNRLLKLLGKTQENYNQIPFL